MKPLYDGNEVDGLNLIRAAESMHWRNFFKANGHQVLQNTNSFLFSM